MIARPVSFIARRRLIDRIDINRGPNKLAIFLPFSSRNWSASSCRIVHGRSTALLPGEFIDYTNCIRNHRIAGGERHLCRCPLAAPCCCCCCCPCCCCCCCCCPCPLLLLLLLLLLIYTPLQEIELVLTVRNYIFFGYFSLQYLQQWWWCENAPAVRGKPQHQQQGQQQRQQQGQKQQQQQQQQQQQRHQKSQRQPRQRHYQPN